MMLLRPFIGVTIALSFGILLHEIWRPIPELIAGLTAGILLFVYFMQHHVRIFVFGILLAFLGLGWVYCHSHWLFANDDLYYQRSKVDFSKVALRGVISSEVRVTQIYSYRRLSFELDLREINTLIGWQNCSGKVLVNLFQDVSLRYGDDVVLAGKLSAPYDFSVDTKFSYRDYLQRRGIFYVLSVKKETLIEILRCDQGSRLWAQMYRWRSKGSRLLAQHFDSAQAGLMQAMLLGEPTRIPSGLKDAFAQTGTTHVLAISGLNVGIVVAVLFIVLRMIPGPRMLAYFLTMIFIGGYVLLTGASASVVRAGIMATVILTSSVIEREPDGLNSLAFAGFIILCLDPQSLFNIGFQLSFMSVLAILLFYPIFIKQLSPLFKKYPNPILKLSLESIAVTLAATLGVGGLIAYYFRMITPVSLLANILVVPLSSLEVILGMGLLACGVVFPAGVALFAVCTQVVLNVMVWLMFFFSSWPGAYFYIKSVTLSQIFGYYCLVAALWLFFDHFRSGRVIDKGGYL